MLTSVSANVLQAFHTRFLVRLQLYDGEEDGAITGGDSPREASANGAAPAALTFEELLDRVQVSELPLTLLVASTTLQSWQATNTC